MMRKYKYLLLLAPILFGACNQEATEGPLSKVTIKAQILEAQTRTSMSASNDQKYNVLWSDEDEIVIGKTGSFTLMSLTSGAGTKIAQFTGDEPAKVYGDCYAAVYPVQNALAGTDDDYIYVGSVLSDNQTFTQGTFSKDLAPMAALSDDAVLYQFHNLYSIIQLPILGKGTLRKIELFGNANEDVAGRIEMLYDKTDGTPVASTVDSDNGLMLRRGSSLSKRVTLTFGESGLALSQAEPVIVNIMVLPGTFSDGFTLNIYDTANDEVFEKTTTESVTIRRSWVKRMKSFVYSSAESLEFEPDVVPWNNEEGELLDCSP